MVDKKNSLAKTQIIIGIILLIASIIAFVIVQKYFENKKSEFFSGEAEDGIDWDSFNDYLNEGIDQLAMYNTVHNKLDFYSTQQTIIACTNIIIFILSLMIIFGGLNNLRK